MAAQYDDPPPEAPKKIYHPPKVESEEDVVITPEKYTKRNYDEVRLDELRKQKEFQYDRLETQKIEYRQRTEEDIQREKERQQNGSGSGGSGGGSYERKERVRESRAPRETPPMRNTSVDLSWLLYVLLAVGIIFLVLFLLGFRFNNLFGKNKSAGYSVKDDAVNENDINQIKFETELEKAIRLKNYKLAVRILYLESLKKLNDQQLIDWKINKTNWDYVNEVKRDDLRPLFKKITNSFDYIWYGDFTIDESTFRLMQDQIQLFKNKI
jgi:hypothetical protein